MTISEIIKAVAVKGSGEVFEHLSAKQIAGARPEEVKQAIISIGKRIDELNKVQAILTGLSRSRAK